jgi:hypothetical protein
MDPDKLIQIIAMLADAHDFSLVAITLEGDTEDGNTATYTYEVGEGGFDA